MTVFADASDIVTFMSNDSAVAYVSVSASGSILQVRAEDPASPPHVVLLA